MTCPNDDQNFTKVLKKILKRDPTPEDRKKIFYQICIVARLSLLLFLYFFSQNIYIQYSFVFLSMFAIYNLSSSLKNGPNTQWWSKKFQLIMSICMSVIGILVIGKKIDSIWIPISFGISLLGGFLESLSITFC